MPSQVAPHPGLVSAPAEDLGGGWHTHSTQSANARGMDSLARTRKLPSLPALESSSSALERVMLPWFQTGTMVGVGLRGQAGSHPLHRHTAEDDRGPCARPATVPSQSPLLLPPAQLTNFLFQAVSEGKETELQRTSSLQKPTERERGPPSTFTPVQPLSTAPPSPSPALVFPRNGSQLLEASTISPSPAWGSGRSSASAHPCLASKGVWPSGCGRANAAAIPRPLLLPTWDGPALVRSLNVLVPPGAILQRTRRAEFLDVD